MSVISFFSYKGGSGRTTTTLNTLFYMVQATKPQSASPLIIIDADNESYGMSMLLNEENVSYPPDVSLQGLGLLAKQDMTAYNGNPRDWHSYPNLNKYFIPVGHYFTKDIENDAVLLLRSDVTPNDQLIAFKSVFSMNSSSGTEHRNLTLALRTMKQCNCTVVFDTPSGTQDMATFSLTNSDMIVCCMRPSSQFELGTRMCFSKLMDSWAKSGNRKNIVFCPSAVPYREMKIDANVYPEHYKNSLFAKFYTEMETKARDTRGVIRLLWDMKEGAVPGIPEVDRFKWQECCLGKLRCDSEDELMAREKYEKLAKLVIRYS